MICPWCGGASDRFVAGAGRDFYLCPLCRFIFVPRSQHVPPEEEKARYLEHENHAGNAGYVRMFEEKLDLLAARGRSGGTALDFGCGYEPVLKTLLEKRGYEVSVYDRFFFPRWEAGRRYDLVISTETFEHLKCPAMEVDRILEVLNPGGWLAIMTRWYPETSGEPDARAFAQWYYQRDPTHIGFFGRGPFHWLAKTRGLEIVYENSRDFIVFQTG